MTPSSSWIVWFRQVSVRWKRFWRPGDPLLLHAGASGELLVAKIRLLTGLILFLIPFTNLFLPDLPRQEALTGLSITALTVVLAIAVYLIVKRDLYRPWVGFATSILDVSLVSLGLALFALTGHPHTAVNSKVVFEAYFLAIAGTSLRYDTRICVVVGLLAMAEYAGIVFYAATAYDLNDPSFAPFIYGMFDWSTQAARLVMLGVGVVLSLSVVRRAQQLRKLSTIDRMTGLFNRGHFDERLGGELSRARRSQQPLSLVMIDVDHFKRFNDNHGHAAGDTGLRTIANTLRQAVRRSDIVARYGGEEFVVVFPDTSADAALEKVEAIRASLAQTGVRLAREQVTAFLTISAGVATFPADGINGDELLDAADGRLFKAKESGRNRVIGRLNVPAVPAPVPVPVPSVSSTDADTDTDTDVPVVPLRRKSGS